MILKGMRTCTSGTSTYWPRACTRVSRLLRTSGLNVRVLKLNLTAVCGCIFFYSFIMSTVTASGNVKR